MKTSLLNQGVSQSISVRLIFEKVEEKHQERMKIMWMRMRLLRRRGSGWPRGILRE